MTIVHGNNAMIVEVRLTDTLQSPILMAVKHASGPKDERRVFLSIDTAGELAAALANLVDAIKRA